VFFWVDLERLQRQRGLMVRSRNSHDDRRYKLRLFVRSVVANSPVLRATTSRSRDAIEGGSDHMLRFSTIQRTRAALSVRSKSRGAMRLAGAPRPQTRDEPSWTAAFTTSRPLLSSSCRQRQAQIATTTLPEERKLLARHGERASLTSV